MDKYIGNKKSIVENLEERMTEKKILDGVIFDAFSGTNNVGQYFKQRGFSIISCDINSFSNTLGVAYLENNSFPEFKILLTELFNEYGDTNKKEVESLVSHAKRRINNDKIFQSDYVIKTNFDEKVRPLAEVLWYMNNIDLSEYKEEDAFFYNHYSIWGDKSEVTSLRGTTIRRNYFSKYNAQKLGLLMNRIKDWKNREIINFFEEKILLTAIIEEVTLIANVAGTFHDFNRNKLFPNAKTDMKLRIPLLNISEYQGLYKTFEGDSNQLHTNQDYNNIINKIGYIDLLYIDPPYNFRQYSDYYHLLNFIADYCDLEDLIGYGENLKYVRGQNMKYSTKSQYSYKETFTDALSDLISNTKAKHVLISYYDENNHWNHGLKKKNYKGRSEIIRALKNSKDIIYIQEEPDIIQRTNYQSRNGEKKKKVDELLFYGRKEI